MKGGRNGEGGKEERKGKELNEECSQERGNLVNGEREEGS